MIRTTSPELGRILVADDDRLTREALHRLLTAQGYTVECVNDGEAALERASRGGLDLVLVDVMMPRINGFESCRIIKSLTSLGFLPVVLLTSRTDTASRVEGMRVGADDYVGKPIDERELLSRIGQILRMKRLHDEVAAARARLEELSTHDELTGLLNFRQLNVRLGDEFRRSERYHDPLACLLLDIDGLRHWNDTRGRHVGDNILRDVGRSLRGVLRDVDIVARYGGDEFLAVLPSSHFAGALAAADRVFREISNLSWPSTTITVSLGVSLFPSRDVRSKDQLLRAAEASLLRSKRDGGNRICVFQHQGYIYSPNEPDRVSPSGIVASPPQPDPRLDNRGGAFSRPISDIAEGRVVSLDPKRRRSSD